MEAINLIAPRNYGEMTEKQIRYVAALLIAGTPEETIWTKCFIRFTGIKPLGDVNGDYFFSKRKLKGFFKLTVEEVNSFSKKMDFLTKSYAGIRPVSKIGKLKPCDELLCDTTFLQYLEAENYYQKYLYTKDVNYLNALISTLYQKGKDYDNSLTSKRAKYIDKHATEVDELIVLMWMVGVKDYFSKKFKYLFKRIESDENNDIAPDMYRIIQDQVRMLSDGDVTKRNKVLKSNTWDALDEMDSKIREAKEMEKRNNI